MRSAPCKDCDRRHIGCHSMCNAFKDWKKEVAQVAAEKAKADAATPALSRKMQRFIWKGMRWK